LAAAGAINIGIGVACGTVAFGAVGQGDRLEMTVIGSPVNTSAKLEKHNKVLHSQCIISRKTWDNAISEGYVAKLGTEFLKSNVEGIEGVKNIVVLKT
jgi:adenylate cyclase